MTFSDLQLIPPILRALDVEGYTSPTPIQVAAVPHVLNGRDLLGCAQTGTGKTAAFALPILQAIDQSRAKATPNAPSVLVLSPTRELAAQIDASFETYGRFVKFRRGVVFGGVSQGRQVRSLQRGVHVLVATPGRLRDLMGQGHVRLDRVEVFVLDEADRMLDMGFLPDLKAITSQLPKERQSLFFSATMPGSILDLAGSLLTDPVRVSVTPSASTVEAIDQRVLFVQSKDKRALLCRILGQRNHDRALIFTRTKHGADRLARQLTQNGHNAAAMHGNKSQSAREQTLRRFRGGAVRVLVATDLAARGIDVDGISHVINFDLPHEPESYVHRIGRTGRAGASGVALSFCESKDHASLRAIEKLVRQSIQVESDHPFHAGAAPQQGSPFQRGKAVRKNRRSRRRPWKRGSSASRH